MGEGTNVRRLLWLGMGLILLIVVGVLLYDWWPRRDILPPAAEPASGVTAREALAPAAELAAQWQEDARLAVVSGRWSGVEMQQGDDVEWAFQFFSPSTQRLALVLVSGGAARMVRDSLSPYRVPTFSTGEWRVDSDQALRAWWDSGGSTVVARRPDVELAMQLRVPDEGDDPVWTVAGVFFEQESAFVVVVNATSGVLVEQ